MYKIANAVFCILHEHTDTRMDMTQCVFSKHGLNCTITEEYKQKGAKMLLFDSVWKGPA